MHKTAHRRLAMRTSFVITFLAIILITTNIFTATRTNRHDTQSWKVVEPAQNLLPLSINFPRPGHRRSGQFATARELSIWARNRNLILLPDCPGGGLRDFLGEVILPSGMDFQLNAPGKRRVYLHLDLATYRPLKQHRPFSEQYCDPLRDRTVIDNRKGMGKARIRWLEVIVNGRSLKTIYQGGSIFLRSPIRIIIEREHAVNRRLQIRLSPSPGEAHFVIWDAYVSASLAPKRAQIW